MNKKILQKNRLHLPFSWLISEGVKIFEKSYAKGGPFSSFSWLISRGVFTYKLREKILAKNRGLLPFSWLINEGQ